MKKTQVITDEQAMLKIGETLAKATLKESMRAQQGTIIYLQGPLGAGKTTLARGFLHGLGHQGHVKSPTYTIVEPYELLPCPVFHFDFYRLTDFRELEMIGIRDFLTDHAICLMEWPERVTGFLPGPDIACHIQFCNEDKAREITWDAGSLHGEAILS